MDTGMSYENYVSSNVNKLGSTIKKSRKFVLTGFCAKEKQRLISIIKDLKATYVSSTDIKHDILKCTHVIVKKPCKSEKFLCACAAGKWTLTDKYLHDCQNTKKWLREDGYEWIVQACDDDITTNLAKASARWRLRKKKQIDDLPFRNWLIGLIPSAQFNVYKRLIELGGGKAMNISEALQEPFTHVMSSYGNSTDKLLKYHERGIPCVVYEYLAQRLLQDQVPSPSDYSLFPSTTSTILPSTQHSTANTNMQANNPSHVNATDVVSDELTKRRAEDVGSQSPRTHGGDKEHHESPVSGGTAISLIEHEQTQSRQTIDECGEACSSGRQSQSNIRDGQRIDHTSKTSLDTALSKEYVSCDEVKVGGKAHSTLDSQVEPRKRVESAIETDQEWKLTDGLSNARQDRASVDLENTSAKSSALHLAIDPSGSRKSQELINATTPLMQIDSNADSDRSNPKREVLQEILDEIRKNKESKSLKKLSPNNVRYVNGEEISPKRFGSREMTMLESFVDASHANSILISCRMLISVALYPPPDLLFLIMKRYILESDSSYEVRTSLLILHQVLLYHSPSLVHIRNDDIYMKAFGVTNQTESKLLMLANITLSDKVRLWNNMGTRSSQWEFFHSVLKCTLRSTASLHRRHNAVLLFSFIASVLEKHPPLVQKMFCTTNQSSLSSLVKILVKNLRKSIEESLKESTPANDDGGEEQKKMEVSDKGSDIADDGKEELIGKSQLAQIMVEGLATVINSVLSSLSSFDDETSKFRQEIIASRLADVFHDADHVVVNTVLSLVEFPSKLILFKTFLDRNFLEGFAELPQDDRLSMHLIVQRYLRLVPKKPKESTEIIASGNLISSPNCSLSTSSDDKSSSSQPQIKAIARVHRDPAFKLTSANVNRRNVKGETPLHRACIQNQPARVVQLLAVPGIDPNSRDNAGWTSLSEACNHGHVECVKELLRLPLKHDGAPPRGEDEDPPLVIDLLACPEEGMTPLHDTMENGHVEVARMLLEKGGVELLYVTDKDGRSPLDVCASEEFRSIVLDIALEIGVKTGESHVEDVPKYTLPDSSLYEQVLPGRSLLTSSGWINACRTYVNLVHRLTTTYVSEASLLKIVVRVGKEVNKLSRGLRMSSYSTASKSTPEDDLSRVEEDIAYLFNWEDIEKSFNKHLQTISDNSTYFCEYSCLNKGVRNVLLNALS